MSWQLLVSIVWAILAIAAFLGAIKTDSLRHFVLSLGGATILLISWPLIGWIDGQLPWYLALWMVGFPYFFMITFSEAYDKGIRGIDLVVGIVLAFLWPLQLPLRMSG